MILLVSALYSFFLISAEWSQCAVLGALLGTQNGREVEIVNTFELAVENNGESVDHTFFVSRRDQCKYLCQLPFQFRQLTV